MNNCCFGVEIHVCPTVVGHLHTHTHTDHDPRTGPLAPLTAPLTQWHYSVAIHLMVRSCGSLQLINAHSKHHALISPDHTATILLLPSNELDKKS